MPALRRAALGSVLVAGFATGACEQPALTTDLNPEGPPEVVVVAVSSETAGEAATFCDDTLDRSVVNDNYCPACTELIPDVNSFGLDDSRCSGDALALPALDAPVQDVLPIGAYVRIAFDELLDPSIEVLTPTDPMDPNAPQVGSVEAADPVTVSCNQEEVEYDGYYNPAGSHLSFPAGPSLVIVAAEALPSGASCTIEINPSVTDKDGNAVPAEDRGPYEFSVAPFAVVASSPAADATGVDPNGNLTLAFNNLVDLASLAGNITLSDGTNSVPVSVSISADDGTTVVVNPDATLLSNTEYTLTVTSVTDFAGVELAEDFVFTFTTGAAMSVDAGTTGLDAGLDGGL